MGSMGKQTGICVAFGATVGGIALVTSCVMSILSYLELRQLSSEFGSSPPAAVRHVGEAEDSRMRRLQDLVELELQRAEHELSAPDYATITSVKPAYSIKEKTYLDLPKEKEEELRRILEKWPDLSEAERQEALQEVEALIGEPLAQSRERVERRIEAFLHSPAYAQQRERVQQEAEEAVDAFAEAVRAELAAQEAAPQVK